MLGLHAMAAGVGQHTDEKLPIFAVEFSWLAPVPAIPGAAGRVIATGTTTSNTTSTRLRTPGDVGFGLSGE
jgi:hypothetical protein